MLPYRPRAAVFPHHTHFSVCPTRRTAPPPRPPPQPPSLQHTILPLPGLSEQITSTNIPWCNATTIPGKEHRQLPKVQQQGNGRDTHRARNTAILGSQGKESRGPGEQYCNRTEEGGEKKGFPGESWVTLSWEARFTLGLDPKTQS